MIFIIFYLPRGDPLDPPYGALPQTPLKGQCPLRIPRFCLEPGTLDYGAPKSGPFRDGPGRPAQTLGLGRDIGSEGTQT